MIRDSTHELRRRSREVAVEADNRDDEDGAERMREVLLSWGMKAGRHDSGWAILERALAALAALAALSVRAGDAAAAASLITKVATALAKPRVPSQEQRERAARALREIGRTYRNPVYALSAIDHAIASVDRAALMTLLDQLAALLEGEGHSPRTSPGPTTPQDP